MIEPLTVRMKVPIPSLDDDQGGTLVFLHWLPIAPDRVLEIRHEDGSRVSLSFDLKAAWWASSPSEEEVRQTVNVGAHYVFVEVMIPHLDANVADRIRAGSQRETDATADAYFKLGEHIHTLAIEAVNRLLTYARSVKGQYWLRSRSIDHGTMSSAFARYYARAWIGAQGPFDWRPSFVHRMTARLENESRFIREDEWPNVVRFVTGSSKGPLVGELLANAEDLASRGYRRSAVMEGVAALEVALSAMSDRGIANTRWLERVGTKVPAQSLEKHIDRLGFSATVRYLLPLLVDELDDATLASCDEAIQARQTIAHQGQRDVTDEKARKFIRSLRALCHQLTEQQEAITSSEKD
jgi:hypothetical protein